jgi:hypothetical protein
VRCAGGAGEAAAANLWTSPKGSHVYYREMLLGTVTYGQGRAPVFPPRNDAKVPARTCHATLLQTWTPHAVHFCWWEAAVRPRPCSRQAASSSMALMCCRRGHSTTPSRRWRTSRRSWQPWSCGTRATMIGSREADHRFQGLCRRQHCCQRGSAAGGRRHDEAYTAWKGPQPGGAAAAAATVLQQSSRCARSPTPQ